MLAENLPDVGDTTRQRLLADNHIGPDGGQDLVLADRPACGLGQVDQHVEAPRAKVEPATCPAQRAAADVEVELLEAQPVGGSNLHLVSPACGEEFSAFFTTRAGSFMTARELWELNGSGTSLAIGGPMTHHRTLSIAATIAASLLVAALASSPRAQPPNGAHSAVDREVRSLKAAYLRCDRAATERLLDMGEAANCSVIYEDLLRVGFGGDFKRLLAWWHAERRAPRSTRKVSGFAEND